MDPGAASAPHHAAFDGRYSFAPAEVAFVGRSGAGKTTLICRLIRELAPRMRVGYVKHNSHGFQVDREGKDTWRARHSGAADILIGNEEAAAFLHEGPIDEQLRATLCGGCDIVLVEGFRRLPLPRVVVLDAELCGRAERGAHARRKPSARTIARTIPNSTTSHAAKAIQRETRGTHSRKGSCSERASTKVHAVYIPRGKTMLQYRGS